MYLEPTIEDDRTAIRRKVIARAPGGGSRVYADLQPTPFAELAGGDLLDTADLCLIYNCSARTVYRWMADHHLKPSGNAGRNYFFRKDALIRWHNKYRPQPGRTPGS